MKFQILNLKGKVIASFEHQHDRDLCFDLLNEDNDLQKYEED